MRRARLQRAGASLSRNAGILARGSLSKGNFSHGAKFTVASRRSLSIIQRVSGPLDSLTTSVLPPTSNNLVRHVRTHIPYLALDITANRELQLFRYIENNDRNIAADESILFKRSRIRSNRCRIDKYACRISEYVRTAIEIM